MPLSDELKLNYKDIHKWVHYINTVFNGLSLNKNFKSDQSILLFI